MYESMKLGNMTIKSHEELREEVEDVIQTIEVPKPVSPFGYMDFSDDTIVSNQSDNSDDPLDTTTTSQTTPKVTDQPDSDLTDKTPDETPEPMVERVDDEQPDLPTCEPHPGEQLQLDLLMTVTNKPWKKRLEFQLKLAQYQQYPQIYYLNIL